MAGFNAAADVELRRYAGGAARQASVAERLLAGPELLNLKSFDYDGLYTAGHFLACDVLDDALAGGGCAQNKTDGAHFASAFAREERGRRPAAWFFPGVPGVLTRLLHLDPSTTMNFETRQQQVFEELFAEGAACRPSAATAFSGTLATAWADKTAWKR